MVLTLLLVCVAAPPRETAPSPHAPSLTHVQQIRELNPERAALKYPVRLRGVVTFSNPHLHDFFLQDSSAGIYVQPTDLSKGLKGGDLIEVTGVCDAGSFAPCVIATDVKVLGQAPLPVPQPYSLTTADSRWLDGQYVVTWAIISEVKVKDDATVLSIYGANGKAIAYFPDPNYADMFKSMNNVSVQIRGVCVPSFDPKERVIKDGFTKIYCNQIPMVEISVGAPQRIQAIDHLLRFSPHPHPGARRVIVTGVVVGFGAAGSVYVQDETGGVMALPETANADLKIGRRAEVTGLLAIKGRSMRMVRATLVDVGEGIQPTPVPVELAGIAQGQNQACRVVTAGRIDEITQRDGMHVFTIVDGSTRLDVHATLETPLPPSGSRIRVIGVPGRMNPFAQSGLEPVLFVNSPHDLAVIDLPPVPVPEPWWATRKILVIVGVTAALAAFAFVWVITLRRQVHRQTEQLRQHFEDEARLEEKLRTARKLEALGRLAGGIAHDFNNLLTVINGCGELLQNDLPADSVQRELASDIRNAGDKAASLVSQLLLFSRQQTVKMTSIDLNDAVWESERILKRIIGETITVECDTADDTPAVKAESTLIQQIILNLAVNARDAMPGGGKLRIQAYRADGVNGPLARLTVSDNGVGMDDVTQHRIFEPFFTTKGIGEGTGLGLATVYGIVQTLAGEIRCRSTLGEGTTFEVDLPSTESAARAFVEVPAMFVRGQGTILLAEDDAAVRDLTCKILETAGYEVLAADSPTEAASIAKNYDGTIHLLLTDMVMPELNGRELAELIQPLRPHMHVLFMSGYSDDEFFRNGVEAEELVLISKPFTPAALTAKVDEVMHPLRDKGASHGKLAGSGHFEVAASRM
ncbi:hypothetical protein BH11PLA2_BH11PLA2_19920 [soil metagenome]